MIVASGRPITLTCNDRLACIANTTALMHVLEHLVDNAIKHTPAGSPIEIAAFVEEGSAVITVSDRGATVVDDDLFQPFARGEPPADAEAVDGSGLGLFLVRSLVSGMAGTVEAGPNEAGGNAMRIELPLERLLPPRDAS